MQLEPSAANVLDVYHTLVGVVTPRPIAWVTTVALTGAVNLAPFSFFNAFGSNPPVVVFSPTLRRDGTKKDTLLNVEATLWQWRTEIGDGRLWRTDGAFTYTGARGTPEVTFTEEIGARYDPDEFLVDLSSGSAYSDMLGVMLKGLQ